MQMKEAIVSKGPKVELVDVDIPEPNDDQVCIRVVYSGSNPKDWKLPEWTEQSLNQGDDIAGYVHSVGSNVTEFKKGDRVAAFHEIMAPHGSYAEYAIAWAHTTFHIPNETSFEEAATLPLAAMTAAIGLYLNLGLPPPWRPTEEKAPRYAILGLPPLFKPAEERTPLLVYGGASAVGAFAIQFAKRSRIHPIIAVAGRGIPFVETLLDQSKGDVVIDYRKGHEAVVAGIKDALKGEKLSYCLDAVSENGSFQNAAKVVASGGHITVVLPGKDYSDIPDDITHSTTSVGRVHDDAKDHGFVYFRLMGRGLKEGWFKPHPHEIIPGGLSGVEKGLTNLKEGKASATKYVFRIADTPGATKNTAP